MVFGMPMPNARYTTAAMLFALLVLSSTIVAASDRGAPTLGDSDSPMKLDLNWYCFHGDGSVTYSQCGELDTCANLCDKHCGKYGDTCTITNEVYC